MRSTFEERVFRGKVCFLNKHEVAGKQAKGLGGRLRLGDGRRGPPDTSGALLGKNILQKTPNTMSNKRTFFQSRATVDFRI